jgi:hypothetical protein
VGQTVGAGPCGGGAARFLHRVRCLERVPRGRLKKACAARQFCAPKAKEVSSVRRFRQEADDTKIAGKAKLFYLKGRGRRGGRTYPSASAAPESTLPIARSSSCLSNADPAATDISLTAIPPLFSLVVGVVFPRSDALRKSFRRLTVRLAPRLHPFLTPSDDSPRRALTPAARGRRAGVSVRQVGFTGAHTPRYPDALQRSAVAGNLK